MAYVIGSFFYLFIKGYFYVPTIVWGKRGFDRDMRMPQFHHKSKSCVLKPCI